MDLELEAEGLSVVNKTGFALYRGRCFITEVKSVFNWLLATESLAGAGKMNVCSLLLSTGFSL